MTAQEFIDSMNIGLDVEFEYNGKAYTGMGWPANGIHVGEQYNEGNQFIYPSAENAVDQFMIDGKPLRDIIPFARQTL